MPVFIRVSCCFVLLTLAPAAMAWDMLTSDLDLICKQQDTSLSCDYRPLAPASAKAITAGIEKQNLPVSVNVPFAHANQTVAILFLVDTSDPARENVVAKNIEHIGKMLSAGKPYHRFGLASFDKNLRLEAAIGSSKQQIIDASRGLRATGKTTELYRNVIKAVDLLAGVTAERKAIYLFSDGQAEDRAYFDQDVTRAARKAGVIINSLGYPRSVALSVALQTIRRLSEESGGIYVESDNKFNLPNTFLDAPYENLDSGGDFTVDLSPVLTRKSPAKDQITLTLETSLRKIVTRIPITNPYASASLETAASPVAGARQRTAGAAGQDYCTCRRTA